MMSNRRLVVCCLTLFSMNSVLLYLIVRNAAKNEYVIQIDKNDDVLHILPQEFLSLGMDTAKIPQMSKEDWNNERLNHLASLLSPAYLRVGGTLSDRLIFSEEDFDCSQCSNSTESQCKTLSKLCGKFLPFFILTGAQFKNINDFCIRNKLKLLFDLDVLLRDDQTNEWDFENAEKLVQYAQKENFDIVWQLGNEPNSFRHVFNVTVTPKQLADDYKTLYEILSRTGYNPPKIVGPDTTRPQPKRPDCIEYMKEFLGNISVPLFARSWHQYYLNSLTATIDDFWNPSTYSLLNEQIETMIKSTKNYTHIPMWLTETSSSYGGGAPDLSDSFSSTPLWIDKLGLAAFYNLTVVVRQSLIGANYSIIDSNMDPLPDWWASVIYKKLVGNKVIKMSYTSSVYQRLYAHCANNETNAITLFGVNLNYRRARFLLNGTAFNTQDLLIDQYILNSPYMRRKSKVVTLNTIKLYFDKSLPPLVPVKLRFGNHIEIPPYSVAFWIIKNTTLTICE